MIDKLPKYFEVEGETEAVPFITFESAALDALRRSVNDLIDVVDQLEGEVQRLTQEKRHVQRF